MNRTTNDVVLSLRVPRALAEAYRAKAVGDSTTSVALMRQALADALVSDGDYTALWVSPDVFGAVVKNFGQDYTERVDKLLRFYFADVM